VELAMNNGQLKMENKKNVLKEKSYSFALKIVKLSMSLSESREYVLSKQLLRSGTSVGALVEEANQAESRADFIHKLSIANKEANETHYWLRLLIDSGIVVRADGEPLINDCIELMKILTASINTSKQNRK
jgi:four helix bundle protein